MFGFLWNFYCFFSIIAAIYIIVTCLWKSKPNSFSKTFSECKNWLFNQLYISKFNIHIEQIIIGILLIFPVLLAGMLYLLTFVITNKTKKS